MVFLFCIFSFQKRIVKEQLDKKRAERTLEKCTEQIQQLENEIADLEAKMTESREAQKKVQEDAEQLVHQTPQFEVMSVWDLNKWHNTLKSINGIILRNHVS